jgi:hypothetical protein
MIPDHPSEFKTVELRHVDVAKNDSDVLLEKLLERLSLGPGLIKFSPRSCNIAA